MPTVLIGVVLLLGGSAAFFAVRLRQTRQDPEADPAHRERLTWGLWTTGSLFAVGAALAVLNVADRPVESQPAQGMLRACSQACVTSGLAAEVCASACQCYVERLEERYERSEIDALLVAASRDNDAEARETLSGISRECHGRVIP